MWLAARSRDQLGQHESRERKETAVSKVILAVMLSVLIPVGVVTAATRTVLYEHFTSHT